MTAPDRQPDAALPLLREILATFDDLPPEAIVKEDLLRRGVAFTDAALADDGRYARKSYFIFSFDRQGLADLPGAARASAPEEIRFSGGPLALRPTVVSVRLAAGSPFVVDVRDGRRVLLCDGEILAGVEYSPLPPYYGAATSDGVPLTETVPSIEWGYLLYLTVFRMCQYFGRDEECRFCDMNRNFRQQRDAGRPYHAVKPVERVVEALDIVARSGAGARVWTLTGGSITHGLDGVSEVEFYLRYARAIAARFPGRWMGKLVVQALPADDVRRIDEAGIRIYHPNFEVWDRKLFSELCPGKDRFIGRDAWIARILEAARILGPGRVIPNFVAGVEMARPVGFTDAAAAVASTREGIRFLLAHGIVPRFTVWCPEALSDLGAAAGPAPLRYHAELLRAYRDEFAASGLPLPEGYGEAGAGRAVFSVSSFMDVIGAGGSAPAPGGTPR